MEKDFPSSLQECFTYQKACYLHVSRTFDHSCCIPLCEECSEFILLKLRTFDLSEVFEVAADVKHYLALSCLPVCIVSQNRHQYLARTSGYHYKALNRFSSSKPWGIWLRIWRLWIFFLFLSLTMELLSPSICFLCQTSHTQMVHKNQALLILFFTPMLSL